MPFDLAKLYHQHIKQLQKSWGTAMASCAFDAVVVDAGAPRLKSRFDDQEFPFRPAAAFGQWLPLIAPHSALMLRAGQRPRLVWCRQANFWDTAAEPADADSLADFEVVHVKDPADVAKHAPEGRVAVLAESRDRAKMVAPNAARNPPALLQALDPLRAVKTAYEIACVARANQLAAAGHRELAAAFSAGGGSELALHLRYLLATQQDDPQTPYKNIVALGRNAATLHHVLYGTAPDSQAAESLLVDAGATFRGYHADITRTWLRGSGAAADAFAALIDQVEQLQLALCAAAKLGRPYESLHDEAHLRIAAALKKVGVVVASEEEAVAKDVTFAFFPHGLGHSLGLQTHDVGCARIRPRPDNPYLRNTTPITAGQVLTIEPGVYFIDALLEPLRQGPHAHAVNWRAVDALRPFGGVRIEDDLVMAAGSAVNLTRAHLPLGGGRV